MDGYRYDKAEVTSFTKKERKLILFPIIRDVRWEKA